MEKRVIIFIVLSIAMWASFMLFNELWVKPRAAQQAALQQKEEAQEEDQQQAEDKDGEEDADNEPAAEQVEQADDLDEEERPSDDEEGGEESDGEKKDDVDETEDPDAPMNQPRRTATIGSFLKNSPFKLLVIFTSRGAAVERIEAVERMKNGRFRYRNLDDRSGYLGYLGLQHTGQTGCKISVVPPGTPAALAKPTSSKAGVGLKVDDVLVRINKHAITSRKAAGIALNKIKPGTTAELEVVRKINGADQKLIFQAKVSERPLALIGSEGPYSNGPGPNRPSFEIGLRAAPTNTTAKITVTDPGLAKLNWEIARQDDNIVEFRTRFPAAKGGTEDIECIKRYTVVPSKQKSKSAPGYHLNLDIEFKNLSDKPHSVAYELRGPNGLPTEGWWYLTKIHPSFFGAAGARDIVWTTASRRHYIRTTREVYNQYQDDGEKPLFTADESPATRRLHYIGVDTQYFNVALLPKDFDDPKAAIEFEEATPKALDNVDDLPKDRIKLMNLTYRLYSSVSKLEADSDNAKFNYVIFAGPKDPELLSAYKLNDVIYYGWFPWVAKPLQALLHTFYSVVKNYGLAIIMLTVLVRACMLPIGLKAARNAAMMQQLAPELKKIGEKYKNDMEKRVQAQRELYAKYNFNPFGGCLLMFIQLPIFIGLYRCLAVDIQLRQAPLIPGIEWASNLAGPDMLWRWPLPKFFADEAGWLGPYLNILPIVTIILFLVQQKLFTPPATDEQTRMQQQMIKFMMIFMGIMFFKVPAGLCIYFIASSMWGICERLLLPKPKPPADTGVTATPRKVAPAGNGHTWRPKKERKKK